MDLLVFFANRGLPAQSDRLVCPVEAIFQGDNSPAEP
jgi:hypothetical protein